MSNKDWLSLEQQISLLKNRGLVIKNEEFAKNTLSVISYYRLMSYRTTLTINDNKDKFRKNVKF
jgi:abortive infection bacteriophage resistance protein